MTNPPERSISFDRAADYYDQTRGFPAGHDVPATRLFVEAGKLHAGSRVLEVGIGTGRIAAPLASQFDGSYHGIDISAAMLARLHGKIGSERVHPIQGDATQLPFPSHSFDAVVAVHIFHLIPNWRGVLNEVARVLKADGVLLHGLGQQVAEYALTQVWNDAIGEAGFTIHTPVPTGSTAEFLTDAGWLEQGESLTYHYTDEKSPQDFLDGIRKRYWSSTWRIDEETYNKGLQKLEDYITAHFPNPDVAENIEQVFRVRMFRPPTLT
jgi:ubiquinone/menaquinone biosynthesis C-methylase UbiE